MFVFGSAGNQKVIDVSISKVKASKDMVDKPLECLGCIVESEWHTDELKQSKRGSNCCLWHIIRVDGNLVESFDEIQKI